MSVIIQTATRATKRKFKDIEEFPAEITLKGNHNHSVSSADALKELRILPEVEEAFYQYFEQGMKITKILCLKKYLTNYY